MGHIVAPRKSTLLIWNVDEDLTILINLFSVIFIVLLLTFLIYCCLVNEKNKEKEELILKQKKQILKQEYKQETNILNGIGCFTYIIISIVIALIFIVGIQI